MLRKKAVFLSVLLVSLIVFQTTSVLACGVFQTEYRALKNGVTVDLINTASEKGDTIGAKVEFYDTYGNYLKTVTKIKKASKVKHFHHDFIDKRTIYGRVIVTPIFNEKAVMSPITINLYPAYPPKE
ncbi:hypothetical protein [Vallitalea sp.]|jgi:hypothetical protein|uniref:hypothetical protein n=1 Tax=Vallitalea sp. TaxID=1882829 RepID=UPI0025DA57D8|nr:hypothetical protein [Vallitalea sp.]MCT4688898.1 hypothetical protein [Vallitalea sp.]